MEVTKGKDGDMFAVSKKMKSVSVYGSVEVCDETEVHDSRVCVNSDDAEK